MTKRNVRGVFLACGALGPVLFIVVFLIEGALRHGYNPAMHPISSLSLGDLGWIQAANFLMAGMALCVSAYALRQSLRGAPGGTWGPLLIGAAGIGLCGAGIFTTDPLFGYPASAPLTLAQFSVHGRLHDLFSILWFLGMPSACFVLCRRFFIRGERQWAVYSLLNGLAMLVSFGLAGAGFKQSPGLVEIAGIFQRLSVSFGMAWISLLSFRFLRNSARDG
jgi:hypothetical membrane protein